VQSTPGADAELNAHFGTGQDLIDLANALHARGMYLMVDVVANHVGTVPGHFRPSDYPLTPSPAHFHSFCIPDWDNHTQLEVEQCKS
jgi:alpha-amylase